MISCWLSHALAIFDLCLKTIFQFASGCCGSEWEKKRISEHSKSNCYSLRHRKVIKYLGASLREEFKATQFPWKTERDMRFDVNLSGSSPAYKTEMNVTGCRTKVGWYQIGTFISCKVYYCYCITLHFGNAHHHLFLFRCNCLGAAAAEKQCNGTHEIRIKRHECLIMDHSYVNWRYLGCNATKWFYWLLSMPFRFGPSFLPFKSPFP